MALITTYYHLHFKNADKDFDNIHQPQDIHIRIYDRTTYADDTQFYNIVEIEGSGDPFHISTIDNSEDKFTGIKPIQATIRFISSNAVNVATFVDSPIDPSGTDVGDPRWYVEAYLNTYATENFIFKGFLNLDDCYEAFMPEKNEVVLVANDGLAGLKNIPLTNLIGDNPTGYNRIADYLAWALSKTGLSVNLNAVFNIRDGSLGSDHFFDKIYLHAKTFEDQIGTCINCYDVIARILGDEAFLTQRCGQWWITRIDEFSSNAIYRAIFNSTGVLQSVEDGIFFDKVIQKETAIFFSQEATTVNILRPYKYIQENYRFEYPLEIVDNIDFSRGTNFILSPDTLDGHSVYKGGFVTADWALERADGGSPQIFGYTVKYFEDINMTYEKERYLLLTDGQTIQHWMKSNPIEIGYKDKIQFSVDRRLPNRWGGNIDISENFAQIRLYGDDGTFWTFANFVDNADAEGTWYQTNSTFTALPVTNVSVNYNTSTIQNNQWQTASAKSAPAPVSGKVYILLLAAHLESPYRTRETHFSNLQLTYIPYINGDYSKYSSYYFKVSRGTNYVNKRDQTVYISSGFKKLFKGQLFKSNGSGGYDLATDFYAWNDIHTSSPDSQYLHPYGFLQAFDVWNQYRNPLRKFQATVQGLDYNTIDQASFINHPHLIHKYVLQDINENTNDRYFMLLSFDLNWFTCEWTGTLIEVFNTKTGHVYSDNLETKYLQ